MHNPPDLLIKDNTEEIGKQAAALSLIEIGLGSFLHSFKIPLAGHILSINQIAFLSRSCFKLKSPQSSLQISIITALLKSLSPAGKKLTPMLAIGAQGMLYYLGLTFFGINFIGLALAVLLSSLWALIQPILFIYILFGKNSIAVAEHFIHEFEKFIPHVDRILLWILVGFMTVKFLLAFFISLFAIRLSDKDFENYQKKMILNIKVKSPTGHSPFILAIKDLLNPLFILTFAMTALFFIFSNSSASLGHTIWGLLRPLALGFILFYIVRIYPMKNLSLFLHRKGYSQLGKTLDTAIKAIQDVRGL